MGDKGLKVRAVVSQLNSNASNAARDQLARLGTVLNIDVQGKDLDRYYMQIIRLFDLTFKIAYDFSPKDIGVTLSRITGRTIAVDDVLSMLAKRIIEILPTMRPIDVSVAVEAYKAVRQALTSL